jgi:cytochrome c peroxidase
MTRRARPTWLAVLLLAGCGSAGSGAEPQDGYRWRLPAGFPVPLVPTTNPMSDAKVALGRHLFHDRRVSLPQTRACASCHVQALGFTNGTTRGYGLVHPTQRNVIALANAAYMPVYTWASPDATAIEDVVSATLVDDNEFDGAGAETTIAARLAADPIYPPLFASAFPGEAVGFGTIAKGIAAFVRTIVSGNSAYDRYYQGDPTALSSTAKRGMDLFFGERFECYHCHGGFTFASSVTHQGLVFGEIAFDNTGLYDVDGNGAYPAEDRGLVDVTGNPADMGKFKAPSLRNVAVTGPYMHDGSIATLGEVVDAYAAGGRAALGGGTPNPLRSTLVRAVDPPLTADERAALVAFLEALTDDAFLVDPRFSNPFRP